MSEQPDDQGGPSFPLQQYLGMELSGSDVGSGTAALTLGEQHANPNGVAHGAVLFALVDTAMGKATMSTVDFSRIPSNGTCPAFDEVSLVLNDGTPIQLSPQASASVTAVCGSTCTPALIDVCN